MDPTVGRIVLYTLSEYDAREISARREKISHLPIWNHVAEGQTYPAIVVRTFGGTTVNLKVFLDGDDNYWATSRIECADPRLDLEEGKWQWPVRNQ